ncbi:unnamed protein product [Schistosoma margrebowiei]|uniref:Uncharacterized protein n=1 Tax=Schistosoma margrebowiei TaxID=48269 RepID=A0A3P7XD82_9TREM|nr:unnamed protein product [Schistosoma margrebowiei]
MEIVVLTFTLPFVIELVNFNWVTNWAAFLRLSSRRRSSLAVGTVT